MTEAVLSRKVLASVILQGRVLHPGDVVRAERGDRLETLLGSCVTVILTDPRRTVAAMCHAVHAGDPPSRSRGDTTYGGAALAAMHAMLRSLAIEPAFCEAFVAGGGNMFPSLYNKARHVGEQNARWALEALARDGVRVLLSDVGGTVYRRVTWTVGPGLPEVRAVEMQEGTQ